MKGKNKKYLHERKKKDIFSKKEKLKKVKQ